MTGRMPRSGQVGPLVKICGLTRAEDAVLAAELGAWAVGFVFAPSPRRVTPAKAREIAAAAASAHRRGATARPPLTVGVFLDASVEEIAETVGAAGLNGVQLHAPQPGAAALREALGATFGDAAAQLVVIQTISVPAGQADPRGLREAVSSVPPGADVLLFDTCADGQVGGTGVPFAWEVVARAAGSVPYLVAGGIGPHNARQALAASQAWGVDVSSGVEQAPGVKDERRLRQLFHALAGQHQGTQEGSII